MVDVTLIIFCPICEAFWNEGDEPGCRDAGHGHQRFERHRHRTPVVLPDGTTVVAVSFEDADPYGREQAPDFGVYLDGRWDPPWPHGSIAWPDFGVPDERGAATASLQDALDRARSGERVEIGCLGGHGRTGTALACLAVLAGHPADDAVAWVRRTYCDRAVETDEQADFVRRMTA
jgi:hypothetical protein